MLSEKLLSYNYILASRSPRRQFLLKELGFPFEVVIKEVDEVFPPGLMGREIASFLCELKASAFDKKELGPKDIVITADTIVWHEGQLLGKPANAREALDILLRLSGAMHEVYTGICLKSADKQHSFTDLSQVWFKNIGEEQLRQYIEQYQPFDKAGAYGVQEWIGYIGVRKITGSFYNVMGFPTHLFYEELEKFVQ